MLSKPCVSSMPVSLDQNEDQRQVELALLQFDNDEYESLGFPARSSLLCTTTRILDDRVVAVSDGESFWLGMVRVIDDSHVSITHFGASITLPTEHLVFLRLHQSVNTAMN